MTKSALYIETDVPRPTPLVCRLRGRGYTSGKTLGQVQWGPPHCMVSEHFSSRTRTPFQQIPHQGMNMSDIVWAYPTKDGRGAVEVMFSNATSGEPCATLTPPACLRACTTNHAAWACWLSFHMHDREIS
jgi:hypothetical protein